jgi:ketosteroid isomerase-like protein
MSQENVELVRTICEPWERGDYSSVEWAHPEIEFVIADGPMPGSWKGLAEMADGYREFLSSWEQVRTDAEEYRELGGGRVLVLVHTTGRGRASGVELTEISTSTAVLFQIRGGKVRRLVAYWDRARALADVGNAPDD